MRAGPSAVTSPCLFETLCKAEACTLLLGHVYGCCGEAVPLFQTCPCLGPACSFLLFFLTGFSLNAHLYFEPPALCHSLPLFFFSSAAIFLCSVPWDRLPFPSDLEELAEDGRSYSASFWLFSFISPLAGVIYYLQVICPKPGQYLQLLFSLWHPFLCFHL